MSTLSGWRSRSPTTSPGRRVILKAVFNLVLKFIPSLHTTKPLSASNNAFRSTEPVFYGCAASFLSSFWYLLSCFLIAKIARAMAATDAAIATKNTPAKISNGKNRIKEMPAKMAQETPLITIKAITIKESVSSFIRFIEVSESTFVFASYPKRF